MNISQIKTLIEYTDQRKDLEAALEQKKKEIAALEAGIIADFELEGVQNLKLDGRCVFIKNQLWASLEPALADDTIQVLKSVETTRFLVRETVNAMTLSAWVREHEKDPATLLPRLPEELAGRIKVTEKTTVGIRSA